MTSNQATLVDTHCHLNLSDFEDDLGPVLARAGEAGVETMLIPGTDLVTSRRAVDLAEEHPNLFAAIGIHPHEAEAWTPDGESELEKLARCEAVVAIGEIGLDFYRQHATPSAQIQAFEHQLDLASRLGLPVIVHQRQAEDEVMNCLASWLAGMGETEPEAHPGVLHAFSGSLEYAHRALELGFYLGIGGPMTFKNAGGLRQTISELPLDRVVLETDTPYLAPHPHRGERNEPSMMPLVGRELALVKDIPYEAVASQTSANASTLFRWNHGTHNGHLL